MLEWWYWIVIGCTLLAIDTLLVNIFYLVWVGLAAIIVGLLSLFFPITTPWQIAVWIALSLMLLFQWMAWMKPKLNAHKMDEVKQKLPGQKGVVVRFSNGQGTVRLQRPLGGSDVWEFSSKENCIPGDPVIIKAVNEHGQVTIQNWNQEKEV